MPDKYCMDTGTGPMVDTEITHLFVAPKEVTLLLVNHQFLWRNNKKTWEKSEIRDFVSWIMLLI